MITYDEHYKYKYLLMIKTSQICARFIDLISDVKKMNANIR